MSVLGHFIRKLVGSVTLIELISMETKVAEG
jgi:hypothetical protein